MGRAGKKIDEKKLTRWKLLDDFRCRLAKAQAAASPCDKRPGGPKRLLLEKDYFSLMLFGLFNPVVDSMRGLCAASHLKRVQEDICTRPVSLGSFSEAQGVFDPELLKRVFLDHRRRSLLRAGIRISRRTPQARHLVFFRIRIKLTGGAT